LPQELAPALGPILKTIASLTERIRDYDRKLEGVAEEIYPETKLLRQVHGVGVLTALTFVLTLEDPSRFLRRAARLELIWDWYPLAISREVAIPKSTSEKHGNKMMRKLLVSSAHYILGPFGEDSNLRRHGEKIASGGGKNAKKRAVVAVARKLSVLLHRSYGLRRRSTNLSTMPAAVRAKLPEGDLCHEYR
jgi:transposase